MKFGGGTSGETSFFAVTVRDRRARRCSTRRERQLNQLSGCPTIRKRDSQRLWASNSTMHGKE